MLNILPKKYSLVALTDTLKGSPCQILSPCCCLDSSPPCRRCGVASLPCLGWWCRCRWLPGQRVIGYQAPGGKWHRCAGRNSHWCWQDDQRVWSGWGGSPASVAPSTHTVLCVRRQNAAVSQAKLHSSTGLLVWFNWSTQSLVMISFGQLGGVQVLTWNIYPREWLLCTLRTVKQY